MIHLENWYICRKIYLISIMGNEVKDASVLLGSANEFKAVNMSVET